MTLFGLSPGRMLVVAPHADDEVLGAGGLMALAASEGWDVRVLFATVSGYRSMQRGDVSSTESRMAEVEAASSVLGARTHEVLFQGEEKHLRLDTVPQMELIGFVERAVEVLRPLVAVVPARGHHHQDHRAVADACAAALRPAPAGERPFVPVVLAYGHPEVGWGGRDFRPTVFVDVTPHIEKKLAALACYRSQVCESPHPRSAAKLREACGAWGIQAGVAYAEPFECLRLVVS
jgi:LmbE family N-acetylglucosaminyl deacetylase